MADPSNPANRYAINFGIDEQGQPHVELVDNLACAGFTWDVPTALQLAQLITKAAFAATQMQISQMAGQLKHRAIMVARN